MGEITDYPELSVPLRKRTSVLVGQTSPTTTSVITNNNNIPSVVACQTTPITTTPTTSAATINNNNIPPEPSPLNSRKRTNPDQEYDSLFTDLSSLLALPTTSDYSCLPPLAVEPIQMLPPVSDYFDKFSTSNSSEGKAKGWENLLNNDLPLDLNISFQRSSSSSPDPVLLDSPTAVVDQNDIFIFRNQFPRRMASQLVFNDVPISTSPSTKLVGAGVSNLGNTCFMSAILQCFTHTVPLVKGLRSCDHISPCDDVRGFCVICAFREHFDAALSPYRYAVQPRKLAYNVSFFSSSFRNSMQEDAHEFMQCSLDKLGRCFPSGAADNLVEEIFGGRLLSNLRCCSCGHSSDTYEPLIDLSLEIENVRTLQHALESFTKVEKIDDKFTCENCNQEVSKEKQLKLDRTPLIAAFHFKRFKREGTYVKKIDTHIVFTPKIDLQPYTSSGNDNNKVFKYELYGVVEHNGSTPTSGHYFCFIRSAPDKWHMMDDAVVTSVFEQEVLRHEAYILFYKREGTPWFSSMIEEQESVIKEQESDPKLMNENKKIDSTSFGI